ncbi:hypothetical protein TNCT_470371 [Trichonephila clavata]|uniref:Uncharacterized protein n=1 Tax=Trichonephila clavata TaxID=2740835 RepID=A0A8X6JEH1_TRICU|nr:hypothetical protein TNCT_470371 [Trichonephila clavata]
MSPYEVPQRLLSKDVILNLNPVTAMKPLPAGNSSNLRPKPQVKTLSLPYKQRVLSSFTTRPGDRDHTIRLPLRENLFLKDRNTQK